MIGEAVQPERGQSEASVASVISERHFVDLSPKFPKNPPDLRICQWPKIAAGNVRELSKVELVAMKNKQFH